MYRFVVMIDVEEAENLDKAYAKLHEALSSQNDSFSWQTTDEAYDSNGDGSALDPETIQEARMKFFREG